MVGFAQPKSSPQTPIANPGLSVRANAQKGKAFITCKLLNVLVVWFPSMQAQLFFANKNT